MRIPADFLIPRFQDRSAKLKIGKICSISTRENKVHQPSQIDFSYSALIDVIERPIRRYIHHHRNRVIRPNRNATPVNDRLHKSKKGEQARNIENSPVDLVILGKRTVT